jgi:hypothetical protein
MSDILNKIIATKHEEIAAPWPSNRSLFLKLKPPPSPPRVTFSVPFATSYPAVNPQ